LRNMDSFVVASRVSFQNLVGTYCDSFVVVAEIREVDTCSCSCQDDTEPVEEFVMEVHLFVVSDSAAVGTFFSPVVRIASVVVVVEVVGVMSFCDPRMTLFHLCLSSTNPAFEYCAS